MKLIEIEIRNGFSSSWEQGCFLGVAQEDFNFNFFEPIYIKIDSVVNKFSNFKLSVPIFVLETAFASQAIHKLVLSFYTGNQRPFGEKIELNVKVIDA